MAVRAQRARVAVESVWRSGEQEPARQRGVLRPQAVQPGPGARWRWIVRPLRVGRRRPLGQEVSWRVRGWRPVWRGPADAVVQRRSERMGAAWRPPLLVWLKAQVWSRAGVQRGRSGPAGEAFLPVEAFPPPVQWGALAVRVLRLRAWRGLRTVQPSRLQAQWGRLAIRGSQPRGRRSPVRAVSRRARQQSLAVRAARGATLEARLKAEPVLLRALPTVRAWRDQRSGVR